MPLERSTQLPFRQELPCKPRPLTFHSQPANECLAECGCAGLRPVLSAFLAYIHCPDLACPDMEVVLLNQLVTEVGEEHSRSCCPSSQVYSYTWFVLWECPYFVLS